MAEILVVDDMLNLRKALSILLQNNGYSVTEAGNGEEAIRHLQNRVFDLILSDLKMEPLDGIEVLKQAKIYNPHADVILLTAYGSIEKSVQAMKLGAQDFICKPYKNDELLTLVKASLLRSNRKTSVSRNRPRITVDDIIGDSPVMKRLLQLVKQIAATDCTVLISGESGTGKELIANALHSAGLRKDKPLVSVNCGALQDTLLESELFGHVKGAYTGAIKDRKGLFFEAEGGTIFLDEIGEISPQMQVKLLRVLQEGEIKKVGQDQSFRVDVRIIAATNRDLQKEVEKGNFREDLYYRLNVIPLQVPPLIEREGDVALLAHHFIEKHSERLNKPGIILTENALEKLEKHAWPGNARELENVIERSVVLTTRNIVRADDLYLSVKPQEKQSINNSSNDPFHEMTLAEIEKELIIKHLDRFDGNYKLTSERLGISTTTLWRKLKSYELS